MRFEDQSTHADQGNLIDAAWQQVEGIRAEGPPDLNSSDVAAVHRLRPKPAPPPESLPGYRIVAEVHRGGQGVVYEGVQESTRRTVAIKIMHGGPFAGPRERARFEREIQILARLKHPNIVTVHDSGSTGSADYFVMDFIAGKPLDRYVAERRFDLDARLRLFAKICAAVNVAHLHGVIHRDLKPANIRIDANGEPHVLDFGLAKSTGLVPAAPDSDDAMTLTGQFVGSLPWASPEQAEGRIDDIDVRTDVYSLGVILYQLLAGEFPYAVSGSLRQTSHNIVNAAPKNPRLLNRQVDDEVATIALKALRKERESRYQNAGELGRDIGRYLAGEPIEAKRDSLSYVLRKYVVRHRLTAGVAGAFALLIVVSLATTITLWRQAAAARDAEVQQRKIAQESAGRAASEANRATAVSGFLQRMLMAADPTREHGPDTTVKDLLDAAADELDSGSLTGLPEAEGVVRLIVGSTYLGLNELERSRALLESSLEVTRKHFGPQHREVAICLGALGVLERTAGNLDRAEAIYREALAIVGDADEPSQPIADLYNNFGMLLYKRGAYEEAERYLRRALEIDRELRPDDLRTATALNNLGLLARDRNDLAGAEACMSEALAILRKRVGDDHPRIAALLEGIGSLALKRNDFETTERYYRQALEMRRRLTGGESLEVSYSLNNLGYLMMAKDDVAAAEPLYREALAIRRKLLPPDHPSVAVSINSLGNVLARKAGPAAAEPLYREALQIKRAKLGDKNPSTLLQKLNLANVLRKQGRPEEAEPLIRETVAAAEEVLPVDDENTAMYRAEWGACLLALDRLDESGAQLRAAYEVLAAGPGSQHVRARDVAGTLAELYEKTGSPEDAAVWRSRAQAPASQPVQTAQTVQVAE